MTPVDPYFDDSALRDDLKSKTVGGGMATGIAQGITLGVQLGAVAILARLLEPADFGLVAMVAVVTGFAGMFVDAGLSMATVQRDKLNRQQVSNLFWLASLLGTAIALIVAALAPLIAWFYDEPRLFAIVLAMTPSFVFAGLTVQHQALLRRAMQFKRLAVVQVASVLIANLLAIACAAYYRNYWALVVLPIANALVRMVGTWLICNWMPGWPRRGSGVRSMVAFGMDLTGFNILNYLARNADKLLIGWYWGATPLGYYERAYKILMFPLQQINGPMSAVAMPALSRVATESQRYRSIYFQILQLVLLLTVPFAALMYVTRDWCVDLMLGPQFAGAVPIFAWLSVGAILQPFSSTTAWLFISQGRGRELLYWGAVSSAISTASFLAGLPWGPIGVAAAYVGSGVVIRAPVLVYWVTRSGPVRARDILAAAKLPAFLGAVVFAVLQLFRSTSAIETSVVGLAVAAAIAAVSWLAALMITPNGRAQLTYLVNLLKGTVADKLQVASQ